METRGSLGDVCFFVVRVRLLLMHHLLSHVVSMRALEQSKTRKTLNGGSQIMYLLIEITYMMDGANKLIVKHPFTIDRKKLIKTVGLIEVMKQWDPYPGMSNVQLAWK